MFLRSLIITVSLTALSATSVQAGWFDREKSRTRETHAHHLQVGSASTRAYVQSMHTMHKSMRVPRSGNVDVDFARQMIPHHQAALAMAQIQQKYGRDAELKKFNDWVIMAQTVEIGFMKNWLHRKDDGKSCKKAEDYFGAAMKAMHRNMTIRYTGNADVDYVRGMIAHHQGAVDMAAILLAGGADPDLNNLANDVYSSQTHEISWLQNWLEERSYKQ